MSRSSVSSESTMSQTAGASTRTAPIPPTNTYASTYFASSSESTRQNIAERPKQSGSRHGYRGSQILDDALSSSHGANAPMELTDSELAYLEDVQNLQKAIPHPISGASTSPSDDSFKNLSLEFVLQKFPAHLKNRRASKIILLLHDYGGNQSSLKDFAEEHLKEPDTLYVLLRGIRALAENDQYHWADSDQFPGGSFLEATNTIGELIVEGLIKKHNIPPRSIVLLGHGQGGMVALSLATSWDRTELGGVITIGGPLPEHFTLPSRANVLTPALVLGGTLGNVNATAEKRIRDFVMHVDVHLIPDIKDRLPQSGDQTSIFMLKEFFAHRLWRKEWEQPSVLTLDGGGIRGYGTLLIIKELMNRIGELEKRIDPNTHSSFYPQPYRPTTGVRPPGIDSTPASLDRRATNFVEPTSIADGLQNSHLFYPCHYFSYIGGTSTGGLISIMLSRLRMSVEDSLDEYKRLGGVVFGSPRPIPNKGIFWHKFSSGRLHAVIDDVVQRHHSRTNEFRYTWPSEEDFCRTVVVAIADTDTVERPYLFRTYEAPDHGEESRRVNGILNPGPAQNIEIYWVGRATSAAPTYFAPAKVPVSDRQIIRFKDGGFGCNNPSYEILRDVRNLHGGSGKNIGPFISIGTGTDRGIELFPRSGAFSHIRDSWGNLRSSIKMVSLTANAHSNMVDAANDGDHTNFHYFRFDGGRRLGQVKLDAWKGHRLAGIRGKDPTTSGFKTIEEMDTAVAMYLRDPEVSADLDAVAELLVRRRRYRIRDESQWDRYACASWYHCPWPCTVKKRYDTLSAFREHVLSLHRSQVPREEGALETTLAKYRHCWTYPTKGTGATPTPVVVNGNTNGHTVTHTNGVLSRDQVEPEPQRIVQHASV